MQATEDVTDLREVLADHWRRSQCRAGSVSSCPCRGRCACHAGACQRQMVRLRRERRDLLARAAVAIEATFKKDKNLAMQMRELAGSLSCPELHACVKKWEAPMR